MVDILATTSAELAPGSDSPATITEHHGGSAANVASWLAHLGAPVELTARVGVDERGDAALAQLIASGVTMRATRDPDLPTGRCLVIVTPDGERTMFPDPGAHARRPVADIDTRDWRAGEHLHASGYSLLREGSRAAVLTALERARDAGLSVSVDASSEAPLLSLGPDRFLAWLAPGDLLFANGPEARALTSRAGAHEALDDLAGRGLVPVLKWGAHGAAAAQGGRRWSIPAAPATARDSTGAGDAFAAGFLASWTRAGDIEAALGLATRIAARAVSQPGGRP
jgi:sugar/nucleoside kinase (ribokinase family)